VKVTAFCEWIAGQNERLSVRDAVATSIAFVRCHFDMDSVTLANHIRQKASVLVAPGAYLGTEHYLRITVGYEPEKVKAALSRIADAFAELPSQPREKILSAH
jgi:aspartate/methionine/tyrosine aminotransferase